MPVVNVPNPTPGPPEPDDELVTPGVPPASTHYIPPYCLPGDIPSGLITDSTGALIADANLALAICAATEILFDKSGRKYRSGRSIVRPTPIYNTFGAQTFLYPYSSMAGYGSAWGFGENWSWSSVGMGWWQAGTDLAEIRLQAPVTKINSVIVDGAALTAGIDYSLYDRRRLVRNIDTSGTNGGAWPWNQTLQLPITEPGTWQIDYEWGRPITAAGKAACIELASEYLRAMSGQDPSKVPQARTTSVSTQGVTVNVADTLDYLKELMTGLPLCDLFLSTVNPAAKRRRSAFWAPNTILERHA